MLYFITTSILFLILKVFYKIQIKGKENIPRRGAFIVASNHSSYLDPPIIASGCYGRKLNFLAKEELFRSRFFGWYIRKIGAFPVKRQGADPGAIKEAIRRIRKNESIAVFPEGGRSEDGNLRKGLPGIALLATREAIPVVPAFIKRDVCASTPLKSIKPCRVYLKFGKPLLFPKKGHRSYTEIAEEIMNAIKEIGDNFD